MNLEWIKTLDEWERFDRERKFNGRFSRPKYDRPRPLTDPHGNRWVFSRHHQQYIKSGGFVDNRPRFQNSKTMCMNRNIRRRSFGYTDTYSMRERGWPT